MNTVPALVKEAMPNRQASDTMTVWIRRETCVVMDNLSRFTRLGFRLTQKQMTLLAVARQTVASRDAFTTPTGWRFAIDVALTEDLRFSEYGDHVCS